MNKIEIKRPKNLGEVMDLVGSLLAWSVLIVFFVALPFYFVDGYTQLASNKYLFFMGASKYTAIVMGVFFILRICLWGFTLDELKAYSKIKWLDIFVTAFAVLSVISHLLSDFRTNTFETYYLTDWFYEGSLWGTRGWFMGLMTYLCLVMLYFILSRCLIYRSWVYIPIIVAIVLICQWGILNRYSIAPIEMNYDYRENHSTFLASVGNINWFCGLTSVIVPLIWGLYMGAKKKWISVILMIAATITFGMIILNSSDSGYFSLAITFMVMVGFAMIKPETMRKCLELLISLFGICTVIPLIDKINPGSRNAEAGLAEKIFGVPALLFLLIIIALYVLITVKQDKYPEEKMGLVRKIYTIVILAGFGLLILLIVINTLMGNTLPLIGGNEYFFFAPEWGSGRGETWSLGLKTFAHINFVKKLFGAGPDCFFYEMISYVDLSEEWNAYYGSARLTNAHNEIITLLVNNGILGTAAFIGIAVSGIVSSFKASKERTEMIGFALVIVSYIANNIFSFQQITNTPFLFAILGIEAAALVCADKASARLTKKEGKHTMQKGKKSHK